MCDVYVETSFSQKIFKNRLNMDLSQHAWVKKCCTPYIMDSPSAINTCQWESQIEFTNQCDTITCDTICVVDG